MMRPLSPFVLLLCSLMLQAAQGDMVLEPHGVKPLSAQQFRALEAQARKGNVNAQFRTGAHYHLGIATEQDERQALAWYEKAAGRGNRAAQFNLGVLYAQNKGIRQDMPRAVAWFREAAQRGDSDAQFNLGIAYIQGQGVARDAAQARIWLGKAAQQGHAAAQHQLGILDGKSDSARQWHEKAA